MEGNLTLLKDKLKEIAIQILEIERERKGIKEDMADIKQELNTWMPKSYVPKAIKVYLGKGKLDEEAVDEYEQVCTMLNMTYTCGFLMPDESKFEASDPQVKAKREKIIGVLQRYETLYHECNECSVQIRDLYAQAKNSGISVPLLKKLVDFVLHPDKLREYHEDTPLLEAYTEVIPEIE